MRGKKIRVANIKFTQKFQFASANIYLDLKCNFTSSHVKRVRFCHHFLFFYCCALAMTPSIHYGHWNRQKIIQIQKKVSMNREIRTRETNESNRRRSRWHANRKETEFFVFFFLLFSVLSVSWIVFNRHTRARTRFLLLFLLHHFFFFRSFHFVALLQSCLVVVGAHTRKTIDRQTMWI